MAATLQQIYDITQNATFQHRVLAASYYQARQVLSAPVNFPVGGPSWALALSVITNPSEFTQRFINALATDATVAAAEAAAPGSATDTQLVTAAQSVWSHLAGAILA